MPISAHVKAITDALRDEAKEIWGASWDFDTTLRLAKAVLDVMQNRWRDTHPEEATATHAPIHSTGFVVTEGMIKVLIGDLIMSGCRIDDTQANNILRKIMDMANRQLRAEPLVPTREEYETMPNPSLGRLLRGARAEAMENGPKHIGMILDRMIQALAAGYGAIMKLQLVEATEPTVGEGSRGAFDPICDWCGLDVMKRHCTSRAEAHRCIAYKSRQTRAPEVDQMLVSWLELAEKRAEELHMPHAKHSISTLIVRLMTGKTEE